MNIKNRKVVEFIVEEGTPIKVSQSYGSVKLAVSDKIYIAIMGGFYFHTDSLSEGLVMLIKSFYALDIQYPKDAKKVFDFIDYVCCGKGVLSRPQRALLD